ncbi:hypothetical protein [Virgibacillus ihumii]|uniref:hypothetical protein n=1 Tax=Virgibacillus ihumii TaxID=2686091 RepID=UPI00157C9EB5|nr:hypothetical protein [Virgibacillus ihumii]
MKARNNKTQISRQRQIKPTAKPVVIDSSNVKRIKVKPGGCSGGCGKVGKIK